MKGKDFFEDIGTWFMQCIAYMYALCAEEGMAPYIRIETMLMTPDEFSTCIVDAYLDELGIIHRGT